MAALSCALCLLTIVVLAAGDATATGACRFIPLKIETTDRTKYRLYGGAGKLVEVELTNYTGKPADTFSDPPFRVRPRGGKGCEIDGGNWVRDRIYLSDDEKYLLTYEFSGSSGELVIYDTATCDRKNTLDVSGARWSIEGSTIVVGARCVDDARKNCVPGKTLRLDAQCAPQGAR